MPRIIMGGTNLNYEWKEGNHYLDLMGDGGGGGGQGSLQKFL